MRRRKMLTAVGALAAGSAAGIGTGAFTNATIEDRQLTVDITGDSNSQIALIANPDEDDIYESSNPGELVMELEGTGGEGINIGSTYAYGDPSDATNEFAFKITNNDQHTYQRVDFCTYLDDVSWLVNGDDQSFIKWQAWDWNGNPLIGYHYVPYRSGGSPPTATDTAQTNQPRCKNDFPGSLNAGNNLPPGQSLYFTFVVDTTGDDAKLTDKLSHKVSLSVSERA